MSEMDEAVAAMRAEIERQAAAQGERFRTRFGESLGKIGPGDESEELAERRTEVVTQGSRVFGGSYFLGMRDGIAALLDCLDRHPELATRVGLGEILDAIDEIRDRETG